MPRVKLAILVIGAIGLSLTVGPLSTPAAPVTASAENDENVVVAAANDSGVTRECPKPPKKEGDICGHKRILLVNYFLKHTCRVQRNYSDGPGRAPLNPGAGPKTWEIPATTITKDDKGHDIVIRTIIKWRYNVTKNVAVIRVPGREFPDWLFTTNSDCIGDTAGAGDAKEPDKPQKGHYHRGEKSADGTLKWVRHETPEITPGDPMPQRLKEGRSQNRKTGYWNRVEWDVQGPKVPAARAKLCGNATLRDQPNEFVIANVMDTWIVQPTKEQSRGMTKVYVPSLKRWGWLEAAVIGPTCRARHATAESAELDSDPITESDGLDDSATAESDGLGGNWYAALSNGAGFNAYSQWGAGHGVGSHNQFLADVNGDGRDDAVVVFLLT